MIFVVSYDRRRGKVLRFERFADDKRQEAHDLRHRLELEAPDRGRNVEIVILDAPTEDALRKTHGRYFGGIRDIIDRAAAR